MCHPKHDGGLGLRRMGEYNIAMTMKVAWNICKSPKKTWVQLIGAKYL